MSKPAIASITEGQSPSATWAQVSLSLSMLMSSLGTSIANVGLPALGQAFGASFPAVQWVVLAYLLAITALIVSVGRLGDVIGRRRLLLAGIALFTSASLLCGIAPTLGVLIAARALQGAGAAILMALTVALVRDAVPKERTGSAMGLLGTMSAIGTALGPSLGGILITGFGWRAIFLVMLPLGILNALLALRHLPASTTTAHGEPAGYDVRGALLLGLTLLAYSLAVTVGRRYSGWLDAGLLLATILGGALFMFAEAGARSPLIRLEAFRDAAFSASLAANALVSTVMMATLVVGPFFLSRALGLGEALAGMVMAAGPVVSALAGVPAGRLTDRFGASLTATAGLVQMAVGAFALATLPAMYGTAGYVISLVILTPGYQLFQAGNNTSVMMDVSPDRRGAISGMLSLSRNLGLITGASVMGALFAFASGSSDITTAHPEAIAAGMRITFSVGAALVVGALTIHLCSRNHAAIAGNMRG